MRYSVVTDGWKNGQASSYSPINVLNISHFTYINEIKLKYSALKLPRKVIALQGM